MSSEAPLKRILNEPSNAPVIRKLLLTTVAMILLPIFVFFGVRHWAAASLNVDAGGSNLWAGIAAVVTVNAILVFYVCIAWNETLDDGSYSSTAIEIKKTA